MKKLWMSGVAFVIGFSALSATAAVTLPRQITGDAAIGAAAADALQPAIARGGNQFLAVWSDKRNVPNARTQMTGADIYGIRLDSNGTPIEASAFPIAIVPADQENPKVLWNGTSWLVLWETYGPGATGYYSRHINAARVSAGGVVLDAKPIVVADPGFSSSLLWAAATDGVNWAVFYQGTSTGENDILGVRIGPDGAVLDNPAKLVLPAAYYLRFNLEASFAGGVFLLAWQDLNDLQGLRMSSALAVQDAAPLTLVKANQSMPRLGANGTSFLLGWSAAQADFTNALFVSRVTSAGVVQDPAGVNVSLSNRPSNAAAELVWTGTNWMVGWDVNGVMYGARVSSAGTVLDAGGKPISGVKFGPMTASPSGGAQLAWLDAALPATFFNLVKSTPVSSTLIAGTPTVVSKGAPRHSFGDAASSGSTWMIVFRSETAGEAKIMMQVIDDLGNPVMPSPVQLEKNSRDRGVDSPAVAWNGTYFMVVWSNGDTFKVRGQRFLPNGAPVDAAPFDVIAGWSPDIAALNGDFLVTSIYAPSNPQLQYPFAARVRGADGVVLDTNPTAIGPSFSSYPAVTALGNRWLVVYQTNQTHDSPYAVINGTFISSAGVAGTAFNVASLLTTSYYRGPSIATNGANALMAFEDERTSSTETEIVVKRILADGSILDGPNGITVAANAGNQNRTNVAWNGREYVVVWEDQRNRSSILDVLDVRAGAYGARVTADGIVVDTNGFALSVTGAECCPFVAGSTNGKTLVGASSIHPETALSAVRIGYGFFDAGNPWPVVNPNAAPKSGTVPLSVSFNANASDAGGSISAINWDFGDGTQGASGSAAVHSYTVPGNYIATVTAIDNQVASTSNTVLINASAVNIPPVAVATATPSSGPAPLSVTLSALGSYDPDGSLGNVEWRLNGSIISYGSPSYYTFDTQGTYVVQLTVYDDRGASGTASVTITVGAPNTPPIAVASAVPTQGKAPLTVQFSSTGSRDPDGSIAGYSWDFGDGTSSTQANPSHVYSTMGTFFAKLTVTDNRGTSATSTPITITVDPNGATILCNGITLRGVRRGGGFAVSATATIVDASSLVVSGATVSGEWTLPNGTKSTATATSNRTGQAVFNVNSTAGTYVFKIVNITKTGYQYDAARSVTQATATY